MENFLNEFNLLYKFELEEVGKKQISVNANETGYQYAIYISNKRTK